MCGLLHDSVLLNICISNGSIHIFNLILNQHADGFRQPVKALDAHKVLTVHHFCGRDVLIISGEDAYNGDAVGSRSANLQSRVGQACQ